MEAHALPCVFIATPVNGMNNPRNEITRGKTMLRPFLQDLALSFWDTIRDVQVHAADCCAMQGC